MEEQQRSATPPSIELGEVAAAWMTGPAIAAVAQTPNRSESEESRTQYERPGWLGNQRIARLAARRIGSPDPTSCTKRRTEGF